MQVLAWISLVVAIGCAVWIAADEVRRPQPMGVMNVVWPTTALYFSVVALLGYFQIGRPKRGDAAAERDARHPSGPTAAQVALSASHCGAGCMLADVLCAFGIATFGIKLGGSTLWAEYALDLIVAWALGVVSSTSPSSR